MNHDPLCDYSPVVINDAYIPYGVCTCDYINAARADEREKAKIQNEFLDKQQNHWNPGLDCRVGELSHYAEKSAFYNDIKSMSDEEFEMYLDTVRQIERENAAHRLASIVYEALGEASMAWSELPSGVFDSEKCVAIGEKLISVVKSEYMI